MRKSSNWSALPDVLDGFRLLAFRPLLRGEQFVQREPCGVGYHDVKERLHFRANIVHDLLNSDLVTRVLARVIPCLPADSLHHFPVCRKRICAASVWGEVFLLLRAPVPSGNGQMPPLSGRMVHPDSGSRPVFRPGASASAGVLQLPWCAGPETWSGRRPHRQGPWKGPWQWQIPPVFGPFREGPRSCRGGGGYTTREGNTPRCRQPDPTWISQYRPVPGVARREAFQGRSGDLPGCPGGVNPARWPHEGQRGPYGRLHPLRH